MTKGPSSKTAHPWDAVVLGAGAAGLSAALWLARSRRRVLVVHDGSPRNRRAVRVNGYLGLEEIAPLELARRGQAQVRQHGGHVRRFRVRGVRRVGDLFVLSGDAAGRAHRLVARAILVAVGLEDEIPRWARPWYGRRVHHCGDCDGPEYVGRTVVVTGDGAGLPGFVRHLQRWAAHVIVVSPRRHRAAVRGRDGAQWIVGRIASARAGGHSSPLLLRLDDGRELSCHGAFFLSHWKARVDPLRRLRLATLRGGLLRVDKHHRTSVRGAFAAGDVTHGSQLSIVAAAEGAMAALSVNDWLDDPRCRWK